MGRIKYFNSVSRFIEGSFLTVFCLFSMCCVTTDENPPFPKENKMEISEDSTNPGSRILVFDDQVSFELPKDFKALPQEKLKKTLSDDSFRKHIFSNADQTGLVFIYLEDFELKPEDLPEVKNFVDGLNRNDSSRIISEMTEINGNKWFHFEWEDAKNVEIEELVAPVPPEGEVAAPTPERTHSHVHEYTTSFRNKLLRFVFEADVTSYPSIKDAFMKSSRTLKIRK